MQPRTEPRPRQPTKPLLRAALAYARLGLAVFPCQPQGKTPLTEHGVKDATRDAAIIRAWWTRWPDANIGLAMGGEFSAIDIDVKNGTNGFTTLAALEAEHGKLPATPRQHTPSGGLHLLFRLPEGVAIPNSAGKLGPGLDTRGNGGYIIAAPSLGADGKAYQWDPAAKLGGIEIATVPQWPIDALTKPKRQKPHRNGAASDPPHEAYIRAAVQSELGKLAMARQGERNHALNAAAFNLGQLVGAKVLDESWLRAELERIGLQIGLDVVEVGPTIESGVAAGMKSPREIPEPARHRARGNGAAPDLANESERPAESERERPEPDDGGDAAGPATEGGPLPHGGRDERPADDRLKLYRWREFNALPEIEPLIDDLLDRLAMSVVYGASACGKTFFALDLAIRLALGWEVHGLISHPGPVVYIAAEIGRGLRRRLDAFAAHHLAHDTAPDTKDSPFAILPARVDLCDADADTDPIIRRIAASFPNGVALVVIDTLSRAMAGYNENSPEDMTAFIANCDRIREATGAHALIVHHTGKDLAAGGRGHSSLRAATDTEIEITKDEATGIATAKVTKQRDHALLEREIAFRLAPVTLGQDKRGRDITSCVVEPVDDFQEVRRRQVVSGQPKIALDLLRKAIDEGGEVLPSGGHFPTGQKRAVRQELWERYCKTGSIADSDKPDSFRKAFKRAADKLQAIGAIGVWDGLVWLADKADKPGQ